MCSLKRFLLTVLLGVVFGLTAVALIASVPFVRLARRQRAMLALLQGADDLEQLLHRTREQMLAMHALVDQLPSDINAQAQASLQNPQGIQNALRDLLEHRLWISRHAPTASLDQLQIAIGALQRARQPVAAQLQRLEQAGNELRQLTEPALEQAAREPASLRRTVPSN